MGHGYHSFWTSFSVMVHVLLFFHAKFVQTRSHKLKVIPCHKSKTGIGYNRFSNRVIVSWNSLPDKVVNSPNVDTFKRNYDDHLNLSKKTDKLD